MHVLVTGASGLIGGEVVARLARAGHSVTALVHAAPAILANDGARLTTRPFGDQPPRAGDVATLTADIAAPGLGLAVDPCADLIVHAAAITSFDAAQVDYARVNVGGTAAVISLAERRSTPLLQVSTAYVCGTAEGVVLETATGTEFVNGYEAGKAAAEALVRAAAARGLPTVIARPSIVVGDSIDGTIRSFGNIYSIFRLIAEGRIRTLPGAAGASLDLVPIDHVAGGIVALVEGFAAARDSTVHLVAAMPTPLDRLAAAIAAVPGFATLRFVPPDAFDPAALPPRERRYHAAAAALYTAYLQRGPRFDTANARRLVPACPPTGRDWLDRLIGHCLARGFVSARRDSDARAASGGC